MTSATKITETTTTAEGDDDSDEVDDDGNDNDDNRRLYEEGSLYSWKGCSCKLAIVTAAPPRLMLVLPPRPRGGKARARDEGEMRRTTTVISIKKWRNYLRFSRKGQSYKSRVIDGGDHYILHKFACFSSPLLSNSRFG